MDSEKCLFLQKNYYMLKRIAVAFLLFLSVFSFGQCNDCFKNYGGWTHDNMRDLDVDNNGNFYLTYSSGIIKHDSNCVIKWTKLFTILYGNVVGITVDSNENVYFLFDYRLSENAPNSGPFTNNGITYYRGLNLIKLDSSGNFIWNRRVADRNSHIIQNIFSTNNEIYITTTCYDHTNINGQINFNFPYTNNPRAIIVKYDLNGSLINANLYGDGQDMFFDSEIDNLGNIYLSKTLEQTSFTLGTSSLVKIDSNLNLVWTKELSNTSNNNSKYLPSKLFFNSFNNKLYIWGAFNTTVNVLGNTFSINGLNSISQSLLCELDSNTGNLSQIKRFDNNSRVDVHYNNGLGLHRSAYITNKLNNLYIFSSFSNTMSFQNQTINSSSFIDGGITYFAEDLVLFKVDTNNFNDEFIFKSINQTPYVNSNSKDFSGPIIFQNDNLIVTSTFTSKPIGINGASIDNNSGNQNSDVLFYKFNINGNFSNTIQTTNTCLNELSLFSISGNYDSVVWNFGDPLSPNNIITGTNNTSHQYTSTGNYHITVTVSCGTESDIFEKDIIISPKPIVNNISPINECETISGSGICTNFDTSLINSQLIGNQQNITIEYRNSNGQLISNPLPNPYTNINSGGDIINAKVYYTNNKDCFAETQINFNVLTKPSNPNTQSTQTFCIEQNATLNTIAITGQNINWYDAPTNGNLLPNTTALVNGTTYHASQTINGCESSRVSVLVQIQNTPTPSGNANQSFCTTQNATVADIITNGTNTIWYNSATSTTPLANSTLLTNNTTYYATQTINGCVSANRFSVTISLINTLNATNYSETICDNLNDNVEIKNLTSYNSNLISSTGNIFNYYNSYNDALNQNGQINNFANYNLVLGTNTFYVRIDSPNTCFQIVTLTLELVSKPIIPINDISPICEGSSITLNGGNIYDSYTWSTGETSQIITITQPGNYSVIVTENHGTTTCTSTKNFTVTNSNIATIQEIISSDWTNNNNTISVLLHNNSQGDYEYSLNGIDFQESNIFNNLEAGEYTVFVRDKNGCGMVSEELYLLMYPKFFTPNGDGYNDFWKIKFSENEPNLTIKIFDRYGKFLKQLGTNSIGWDGKYLGKDAPSSDYWFVVTRENGKEYKGHFSLKR